MSKIEEAALLSRIVLFSDQRAFAQLVRCYQERVRRFFLMQSGGDEMLADDLAQETFIRVWQRLGSFRQASAFGTWLYQIAYHLWLDHCRSNPPARTADQLDERTLGATTEDTDDTEQRDREQRLCRALAQMPEPARTCITLYYLEEKSIRDIAKITELEESNIRQILSRGRKKLKEIYENTL